MANAMYGRPVYGKRQASMLQGYAKSEFRNFGEFVRLGMKDETKFNQIHATPQFWAARNGLVARSTGRSLAAC